MFKNLLKIFLLLLVVMFADPKPAAAGFDLYSVPGISVPFKSQIEMRICMVRRIFCGSLAMMAVTFVVFMVGILLLNNKIHWGTAIVIVGGIIAFYNASSLATTFAAFNSLVFISNPACDCRCAANGLLNFIDLGLLDNFFSNVDTCITGCVGGNCI